MEINERLNHLFQAYYENALSQEETDELFKLLNRDSDDEQLNALIQQAWQQLQEETPHYTTANSDSILNSILLHVHNKKEAATGKRLPAKLFTLKRIAAAAVVVGVAITVYIFFGRAPRRQDVAAISPVVLQKDSLYNNKAILKLANGPIIVLDTLKSGAYTRQGNMQISKTADGELLYKVKDSTGGVDATAVNTISTPCGGQYQLQLQDGTKVWLNAASTLRFPVSFNGSSRQVELEGEAYFEVATLRRSSGQKMPFHVKTGRQDIEVLGTHFNVNAYNDEAATKTTLLEGRVKVNSIPAQPGANRQSAILEPGEQAELIADSRLTIHEKSNVNIEDVLAWKNNLFNFRDAGIEEVMRQAARWYNIRVHYQGKIPQSEFNGKIPRAIKLDEFLNILRYKGIDVSVAGQDVTIIN